MPTFECEDRFWKEWNRLPSADQQRFRQAVKAFVQDLEVGRFRAGLRVKRYRGRRATWEMTWAPDGRALFTYGPSLGHGPHIIWLRIGSHDALGL